MKPTRKLEIQDEAKSSPPTTKKAEQPVTLHGMAQLDGRWNLIEVTVPASQVRRLVSGSGPEIRDALRRKTMATMGGVAARATVKRIPI
jgi:hypothetical protein